MKWLLQCVYGVICSIFELKKCISVYVCVRFSVVLLLDRFMCFRQSWYVFMIDWIGLQWLWFCMNWQMLQNSDEWMFGCYVMNQLVENGSIFFGGDMFFSFLYSLIRWFCDRFVFVFSSCSWVFSLISLMVRVIFFILIMMFLFVMVIIVCLMLFE